MSDDAPSRAASDPGPQEHGSRVRDRRAVDAWELVRISGVAMCIAGGNGRLIFVNEALGRLVGVDPGDLVGERWTDRVHPDDQQRTSEVLTALARQGGSITGLANRYRRDDGSYRWLEWQATADPNADRVYGVGVDVTGRRHAERRLEDSLQTIRESQQRLRLAVETTDLGIWEHDLAEDVVRWSAQTARIFGYPEKPDTKTVDEYFGHVHPDDRDLLGDLVDVPRDRSRIEYRIIRTDGRIRWVVSNATVQYDDGEPSRVLGTLYDVTDRVESQQRLQAAKHEAERANVAMSELLRRTSHELRTPLNAILGFSRLLATEQLTEQQQDSVDEIVAAGERLLHLVDRVLAVNSDTTVSIGTREPLELTSMVAQVIARLGPLAREHEVQLRSELPDMPLVALAEPSKVEHVLLDLVSNAVLYSRGQHVDLTVHTVEDDGPPRLRVEIRDRGPGLAPDEIERAFTPFDRLGADATNIPGTGLGLPLSRRIIESMGGELGAESTPGYGSCFWFELARAPASEEDA
ncbi:MAG: PAS domain-containing protein [Actinobacteria bacterium]|nr:PAS domain-containing protein [Actinomycetota bacterium]